MAEQPGGITLARLSRAALAAFLLSVGAAHAGDCSGTVVTGGTAVQAIPNNGNPINGFRVANLDTTEALWIKFDGTAAVVAAAGNWPLSSGAATTFIGAGSFQTQDFFKPTYGLSINATTTAHKYSCYWW